MEQSTDKGEKRCGLGGKLSLGSGGIMQRNNALGVRVPEERESSIALGYK